MQCHRAVPQTSIMSSCCILLICHAINEISFYTNNNNYLSKNDTHQSPRFIHWNQMSNSVQAYMKT